MMEKEIITFERFGDYLRFKRKELGVSQQELGLKTNMERTYVSMLETKGNPSFGKIKEISNALGITIEEFFRTEIAEAKPPTILIKFNKGETEKMHKEKVIEEDCYPIPIIKNDKPLKTGKIAVEDIQSYLMLDGETLGDEAHKKLVAVRHIPSIPFPLVVLDLEDKKLTEGEVYAIEDKGIKLLKPFYVNEMKGVVLQPVYGTAKPMAIFGRQKQFIKVMGKAIIAYFRLPLSNK